MRVQTYSERDFGKARMKTFSEYNDYEIVGEYEEDMEISLDNDAQVECVCRLTKI